VRLLCVANWSEGRDYDTLAAMRQSLHEGSAAVHYDGSDQDHNRIVTAFSGTPESVRETLFALAEIAFQSIDMRKHEGVHPRIGALDVCPFILLEGDEKEALDFTVMSAKMLATNYSLPIFLYEKSETGKHSADLPSLRKGQYEGLVARKIDVDFGPSAANPRLGATVMGLRNWLVAMNINLPDGNLSEAKATAKEIRVNREQGDATFAGVRALGLPLQRRKLTQVSLNLTQPDITSPDAIVEFVNNRVDVVGTELVGVIRPIDLPRSTDLPIEQNQIVV